MAMKKRRLGTNQYLNVDLEVYSRSNLQPFVTAMGDKVLALYVGRIKRTYRAHLELAGSGLSETPDSTIRTFCSLIRKLPRAALKLWNGANHCDFNNGVQARHKPDVYELSLTPETLAEASGLNARIVLTIYGAGLGQSKPEPKGSV